MKHLNRVAYSCFFFCGDIFRFCVFFTLGTRELAAVGVALKAGFFDGEAGTGRLAGASGPTVTDLPRKTDSRSVSSAAFFIGSAACFFFWLTMDAFLEGTVEPEAEVEGYSQDRLIFAQRLQVGWVRSHFWWRIRHDLHAPAGCRGALNSFFTAVMGLELLRAT